MHRKIKHSLWLLGLVLATSALLVPMVHSQARGLGSGRVMLTPQLLQAGQLNLNPGQPPRVMSLIGPGPIGAATTTAQFAHLAIGGGFSTTFTFLNTGGTELTGTLFLTGQDGTPLSANLASGSTQTASSSIPLRIQPGGAQFVTTAPLSVNDPTKAGWARVESEGGTLGGVATFQLVSGSQLQSVAGVLSSSPVDSATIPVDNDGSQNRFTGYALANPGTTNVNVKIVVVNAAGTPLTTLTLPDLNPMLPGRQLAKFLHQDYAPAAGQFQGSMVIIPQGGQIVVVALVQAQGQTTLYTAIPVIPAKAPGIN